jgi:precorrin-2 dehydrogenase/sirohydrochlorin ferrochelatase
MFPVFLRLERQQVVVVGGGPVGRRKAQTLLEVGAYVRVVALEPRPADRAELIAWVAEPYRPDHLTGATLAVAAATPEVNRRVAADARARGVWVNVADDPGASDFVLPATVRRGEFVLAVGTGGAAPALARRVRERLESEYDTVFGEWVGLLAALRPVVRDWIPDPARRRAAYEALSDWEWLGRLRRDGRAATEAAMRAAVERLAGGPGSVE